MYRDDELLPVSALQHLMFCARQAALIHVEQQWAENTLTLEGGHLHRVVDGDGRLSETRGDRRILRGVGLVSYAHGLVGRADVVELRRAANGAELPCLEGRWSVRPVEYKRGRPKADRCDEVQLCAQALCLEEMFDSAVAEGQLFYGSTRRRLDVVLDASLRQLTLDAIASLRTLVESMIVPRAEHGPKCERCSLKRTCMPELSANRAASRFLEEQLWAPCK